MSLAERDHRRPTDGHEKLHVAFHAPRKPLDVTAAHVER